MGAPTPEVSLDLAVEIDWPAQPQDLADHLHALLVATLAQVGLQGNFAVDVVLTGDRQMRRVNREHRGIDAPTDVLSFPQSPAPLLPLPADQAWVARPFGDDTHHATFPAADLSREAASATSPAYRAGSLPPGAPEHLGDIIIAIPTVERQAQAAGHSMWWELCFLVAHGALHLVGYDDYYEPGYQAMVARQDAILHACGVAR